MDHHESQTRRIGQDWKVSTYYDRAEQEDWMEPFWGPKAKFQQFFETLNTRVLVELACGHGRHTAHILHNRSLCDKIECVYLMDINEEQIYFCKKRFSSNAFVHPVINNGYNFQPLQTNSVTAIFSYDAMVHFEYDAVISYLVDAFRVLVPGGRALFHHSNHDKSPGAFWSSNPHGRNFMSKNLFAHVANRAGFEVLEQSVIHWDEFPNLDCISLIERRAERDQTTPKEIKRSRLSDRILHRTALRKVKQYFCEVRNFQ